MRQKTYGPLADKIEFRGHERRILIKAKMPYFIPAIVQFFPQKTFYKKKRAGRMDPFEEWGCDFFAEDDRKGDLIKGGKNRSTASVWLVLHPTEFESKGIFPEYCKLNTFLWSESVVGYGWFKALKRLYAH